VSNDSDSENDDEGELKKHNNAEDDEVRGPVLWLKAREFVAAHCDFR
jgi:hypothetical protein